MLSEGGGKTCQQPQQPQPQQQRPASRRKHRWSKGCVQGRRAGGGGWTRGRTHHHYHHHQNRRHHPHLQRHQHPRHMQQRQGDGGGAAASLRPVNVKGNRARGMRAPMNTNQFLMHEKYQLLHMRSDSVGSDSGSGSDSDTELTDMDSYLGALENARGALLDSTDPLGAPGQVFVLQEDSLQYFPSEDDLMQSQNFMQRDFVEFCDILTS
ncbi:uncharacterized protein LOC142987917 [Genypterus blacodes]|uniref:uncharacterized protein LOC142987917 n=1 Tax=Genypterus blacodes TaxID=154954 RepID=UPI003F76B197